MNNDLSESERSAVVFESTESTIIAAVERALTQAGIPYELVWSQPPTHRYGPAKPPKQLKVAMELESRARLAVEQAVVRRGRLLSLQPNSPRPGGLDDACGSGGNISFIADWGGDCGGEGGDCP